MADKCAVCKQELQVGQQVLFFTIIDGHGAVTFYVHFNECSEKKARIDYGMTSYKKPN